jgi:penicillin-binding protein 2
MELARPGERRRREERERDTRPLTRRAFVLRGAMGLGFAALTGKLWSMQIAEGNAFQQIARENTTSFQRLKAPRGRITDRAGRPLAENKRSWSVNIIASRLPASASERRQILDMLAETLQLKAVLVLDRAQAPIGSEAAIVSTLGQRLPVDGATLLARLMADDATLVLVKDELSPEEAAALQTGLSDIPGVRVLNQLDFALATHGSDDIPMVVKQDVEREMALAIASNAVYMPGVVVDDSTLVRQYPGGPSFAHILGYVGPIGEEEYDVERTQSGARIYDPDDSIGRGGVEQALEKELRGEKGGRWIQVDATGVERLELLDRRLDPRPGLSAQLTIDREFQRLVVEALQEGIVYANAKAIEDDREPVGAGVAIAINPRNGEILAMASLPSFDNQKFVTGISQAEYDAYLDPQNFNPLLDRAIVGEYPPGSVLKPLLACAALQEGVVKPEDKFKCLGNIRVPWTWDETQGNTYPCWEYEIGHGDVDLYKGIAQSCDVYFYNIGAPQTDTDAGTDVHYYIPNDPAPHGFQGLGIERIEKYLKEVFGFGSPTGIELAGEAQGLVPNPKWLFQSELNEYWSIGDTINVSIGQGHLLCTPLQLLNGTAAIANGGTLYAPRLIRALTREDGSVVREFPARKLRDLRIDRQHIDAVREGMRRTVTEGTAKDKITIGDVVIGAKSGTAEFGEVVDGKYLNSHAWFTAFGPFENPEICLAVMIENGTAGSIYAGPVVNRILDVYFHSPGIREAAQSRI